jgi:hypothetical protein
VSSKDTTEKTISTANILLKYIDHSSKYVNHSPSKYVNEKYINISSTLIAFPLG